MSMNVMMYDNTKITKINTSNHSRSKKCSVCERSWTCWGSSTPAIKMSLTARLIMKMSVLVTELLFTFFKMHAITDTLLKTEIHTQIDKNANNNSVDDSISNCCSDCSDKYHSFIRGRLNCHLGFCYSFVFLVLYSKVISQDKNWSDPKLFIK